MKLVPCTFASIAHLVRRAARELKVTDCDGCLWWQLDEADGFCGLRVAGSTATLRCDWIAPEDRGQNLYVLMVEHRVAEARARGCTKADVFTLHPAKFDRWGWQRLRQKSSRSFYMALAL